MKKASVKEEPFYNVTLWSLGNPFDGRATLKRVKRIVESSSQIDYATLVIDDRALVVRRKDYAVGKDVLEVVDQYTDEPVTV